MSEPNPFMLEFIAGKYAPRYQHLTDAAFDLMIDGFIKPKDHAEIGHKIQKRCLADGHKLVLLGGAPVAPHHPKTLNPKGE